MKINIKSQFLLAVIVITNLFSAIEDAPIVRSKNDQLYLAVVNNDLPEVIKLIDEGADISQGNEILKLAVEKNFYDIAKYLISKKADVNGQGYWKRTPIWYAAEKNLTNMIQLLLDNGADPNIADHEKVSPLHIATNEGKVEAVKMLLDNGAETRAKDKFGYTPSVVAQRRRNIPIKDLIDSYNPDLDLINAVKSGNIELAKKAIAKKADVNTISESTKITPLHIAAINNFYDIEKLLIESGANVNATDKYKQNALFYTNNIALAKLLLDNGANTESMDANIQRNRLEQAIRNDEVDMVDLLLNYGVDYNKPFLTWKKNALEFAKAELVSYQYKNDHAKHERLKKIINLLINEPEREYKRLQEAKEVLSANTELPADIVKIVTSYFSTPIGKATADQILVKHGLAKLKLSGDNS